MSEQTADFLKVLGVVALLCVSVWGAAFHIYSVTGSGYLAGLFAGVSMFVYLGCAHVLAEVHRKSEYWDWLTRSGWWKHHKDEVWQAVKEVAEEEDRKKGV